MYKNGASKAKSPCIFLHSFRRRAILKKLYVVHSERCFSTFSNKWSFPDLFSEAYFWLEKCEHEARSCTCHSSIILAVSIATNSLVSITATKMLLTPTRRVGVNIGQKSAIATNSSSDWRHYSVGVNNSHKSAIGTNLTLCMLFVILY